MRGQDIETNITIPFQTAYQGGKQRLSLRLPDGRRQDVEIQNSGGHRKRKKLRLSGKGSAAPGGGTPGDLYIVVNVAPHPVFERRR